MRSPILPWKLARAVLSPKILAVLMLATCFVMLGPYYDIRITRKSRTPDTRRYGLSSFYERDTPSENFRNRDSNDNYSNSKVDSKATGVIHMEAGGQKEEVPSDLKTRRYLLTNLKVVHDVDPSDSQKESVHRSVLENGGTISLSALMLPDNSTIPKVLPERSRYSDGVHAQTKEHVARAGKKASDPNGNQSPKSEGAKMSIESKHQELHEARDRPSKGHEPTSRDAPATSPPQKSNSGTDKVLEAYPTDTTDSTTFSLASKEGAAQKHPDNSYAAAYATKPRAQKGNPPKAEPTAARQPEKQPLMPKPPHQGAQQQEQQVIKQVPLPELPVNPSNQTAHKDVVPTSPPAAAKPQLPKGMILYPPSLDEMGPFAKYVPTGSISELLERPIINPHNYSFIHNQEHTCEGENLYILFVSPSAPENVKRRSIVRHARTYEIAHSTVLKARFLFFIGRPRRDEDLLQPLIDAESKKYGDIVQYDFVDMYKNVRLKAVSMLQWAKTYCRNTKFVVRTDDDISVNTKALLKALYEANKFADRENYVMGRVREKVQPSRIKSSKYFLSKDEYPGKNFPPFALGGLLAYPLPTVDLLYEASLRVPRVWLDDVYITGICRNTINATLISHRLFGFSHDRI